MTIENLAELTWNVVYPDRRKWKDLEQPTRDEWIKVFVVYDTMRQKHIPMFKFGESRHDGFDS